MGMLGIKRRGNPKPNKGDLGDNPRKNEIARRLSGAGRSTILSAALGPASSRGSILSSPGGM